MLYILFSICHKRLYTSNKIVSPFLIISILPQLIKWIKQNSIDFLAK